MKRGNSRGAKGPCQIHVSIRREEIRLDTRPTTEESGGLNWDERPSEPEKKSGVKLPPKISAAAQMEAGSEGQAGAEAHRASRWLAGTGASAYVGSRSPVSGGEATNTFSSLLLNSRHTLSHTLHSPSLSLATRSKYRLD